MGTRQTKSPLVPALLHVRNFAVHERDFHIFVDVELLGAQVHNLVRLTQGGRHLVGTHPLFDGLRLGGWLLILTAPLAATCLLLSLLSLILTALLPLILLRIVADGEQLADRVFNATRIRICQRALGKLEYHLRFVVSRRIG